MSIGIVCSVTNVLSTCMVVFVEHYLRLYLVTYWKWRARRSWLLKWACQSFSLVMNWWITLAMVVWDVFKSGISLSVLLFVRESFIKINHMLLQLLQKYNICSLLFAHELFMVPFRLLSTMRDIICKLLSQKDALGSVIFQFHPMFLNAPSFNFPFLTMSAGNYLSLRFNRIIFLSLWYNFLQFWPIIFEGTLSSFTKDLVLMVCLWCMLKRVAEMSCCSLCTCNIFIEREY